MYRRFSNRIHLPSASQSSFRGLRGWRGRRYLGFLWEKVSLKKEFGNQLPMLFTDVFIPWWFSCVACVPDIWDTDEMYHSPATKKLRA